MSNSTASNEPTVPDRRSKRPAPRGLAAYARKRAVTACQVCRARRTKCDNLKPSCSFCLKTGAICIQSPVDFSSFDPASLKILERLDDVEALLRAMPAKTAEPPSPNPEVATLCPRENGNNSIKPCDILPQTVESVLAWPIFRGLTTGLSSGSPSTSTTSATSLTTLAASGVASYPVSVIALILQDSQQINSLIDKFFDFVHVKNPILSEEDTRLLVSTITIEGISWSSSSCLFLLICALGSIATPFGPSESAMLGTEAYANGKAFFEAAEKRLGSLIASGGLVGAQCFFLSGVYKMCVFRPREAWRFFLQALAICQDFLPITPGLSFPEHRGDGQGRTLHEAVFWSAWKSEMELRGELCLPDFAAGDRDKKTYPSFFPTPPPPSPRGSNNTNASTPEATRESAAWFFYLTEISLRRLALDVSREMLALCKNVSPRVAMKHLADAVPAWERQLQDWVRSLPAALSFDAPAEEDDVCRFVLRGHFINLLETIYWPFTTFYLLGKGREGLTEPRLVELGQKGLKTHSRRICVNKPGFRHRHHGTLPMIRSCTRSASILIAFASQNANPFDMPANWHRDVQAVLDLMRYWEGEYVELAEHRAALELAFAQCQ